jgi:hypothetical protein
MVVNCAAFAADFNRATDCFASLDDIEASRRGYAARVRIPFSSVTTAPVLGVIFATGVMSESSMSL